MSKKFPEKYVWKVLEAYKRANSIVNIQLNSYNHFINVGMQEIVDQNSTITVSLGKGKTFIVEFGQICVDTPSTIEEDRSVHFCYPSDARRLDLTYDGVIQCDIKTTYIDGDEIEEKRYPREIIGRMPIMVKSDVCNLSKLTESQMIEKGECPNDPGGYFIIRGHERTIVSALRNNYNQVIVLRKDGLYAEVRSMSNETAHSALVKATISKDGRKIEFSLPSIKEKNSSKEIPAGVVFKALGYTDITDIKNFIGLEHPDMEKIMTYIDRESYFCQTKEEALAYIGKYAMHTITPDKESAYAQQVVETELFPHLGVSSTIKEQACFLGHILNKLLSVHFGLKNVDDRDNYMNKRVEVCGMLFAELFRNLFKKYVINIKTQLEKRKQRPDVRTIITRIKSISDGLLYCMSKGDWSVQKNASYMRTGVSQILDRMTYMSSISHMRRILLHISNEAKNTDIRQLHASQYGYISLSETPEGSKVGIVLNFAITASVSTHISPVIVRRVIDDMPNLVSVEKMDISNICSYSRVFLNNVIIGFTSEPEQFVTDVKKFRNKKIIPNEVSISYNIVDNDIKIYCDEGRLIRPVFTLTDNKLNITLQNSYDWNTLITENKIHYIDSSETENSVIAMYPKNLETQYNDYCEIHPCCMLGVMDMCIPFPDHSQSPRNVYQCSMGKQAIGIPTTAFNHRYDTILHVMSYPQRPIVTTKMSDIFNINNMPSGVNAIVAIMPFYGYNQEDSVMVNRGAIERGLLDITTYHTYSCVEDEKRDGYTHARICMPPHSSHGIKEGEQGYFRRKNANYSLLDKDGIIKTRIDSGAVHVKKGDVIVGKIIVNTTKSGEDSLSDASRVIQVGEEGVIDRVNVEITPDGYKLVKIVIRQYRVPEVGDKVASRAAQKGTIGAIMDQQDMPFISTGRNAGCVPDILINPLAMPSRMTINQLIECVLAKMCVVTGEIGDATPFTKRSHNVADGIVKKIDSEMERYGFTSDGLETMVNGITGEEIKSRIFVGPTYYQRLKHMVCDKMHARARGLVTTLTRQPTEGRSRDGGKLLPQWYLIVLLV